MTNEEKAKSLWYHFCTEKSCEGHSNCVSCPKSQVHPQLVEIAEWKEEQMIDWFRKNINKPFTEGGYITYKPIKGLHEDVEVYCAFERLVEDFKKAMKE